MSHNPEMEHKTHEPKRVLSVFLCHSSEDTPTARDIYHRLSADGIAPWLDVENILAGQDWALEIRKAIETSDVIIICLSEHSINKTGYVQEEIRDALAADKKQPEGRIFLIPLKMEDCQVPYGLRSKHWVDYFEPDGYERLLRSLSARALELGLEAPIGRRPVTNEESLPVKYASGRNLEQNKAFFDARATDSRPAASSVPSTGRRASGIWELVAECDASHHVPYRGDRKMVNQPSLVAWSPDGRQLVTACDAFGMTRWQTDGGRIRRIGGGTSPYAYGNPTRFFWAPDGDLVLLEAQTALNIWWTVQDANGDLIHQAVANEWSLWGWDTINVYGFHRNRCFNPWRPGRRQLLVARYEGPRLDLIDASALPRARSEPVPPKAQASFFAYALRLLGTMASYPFRASGKSELLADVPMAGSVSLESLGAQDQRIMRYAWDPSGKYVAVTTAPQDDEGVRRVHVLNYEAGEIVASLPPVTTALGWSPGGRLLFCQRWTNAYTSEWKIDAAVWDSHAWTLRELSEEERRQPWAKHFEFSNLGVTDNALNADGTLYASRPLQSRAGVSVSRHDGEDTEVPLPAEGQVPHIAWSPTDPSLLATVSGDDMPSGLRVWRLRNYVSTNETRFGN